MNDNEIIQQYKKYEPFFGSWYLKRFIGEGGFAKVFEIVRNDFGNEYTSALKIITVSKTKTEIDAMKSEGMSEQEIQESLKVIVEDTVREIQLMYKLRGNGNIVGYEDHAVMEHEDGLGWDIFIKMEFLTSLSSYIQSSQGKLAKRDIIKLGIDICKALEACQKFNITHRDIKADNIFISNTGEFKLGDFGIARIIERKDTELSKKGTSAYMAPEVYKGLTYTSAVDIYSLGIVLYRLLNHNRGPFLPEYPKPIGLDERDQALMRRMSGEKFPKPAQVSEGRLPEIVLKACAYRPEERYSSPVFMRQELEAIFYDENEVTNDDLIIVIEEAGGSGSTVGGEGTKGSTVPNEYEATEVLRNEEESTPSQDIPVIPGGAEIKTLCKKCGNTINRDAAFCPICGYSQRENAKAVPLRKTSKMRSEGKNSKKFMLIGGICAAVVIIAGVGIGVAVSSSSSNKYLDEPEESLLAEESETTEPTQIAQPVQTGNRWEENVLMTLDLGSKDLEVEDLPTEKDNFLNTGLPREEILSVTFVDSLDGLTGDAWDLSAGGNGKVMAWGRPTDGGYDLYIGGEGGVAANTDSVALFCNLPHVRRISTNGCLHSENTEDMAGMFFQCYELEAVDLSGLNTSKVTDMNGMFISCESLKELDLSGFDTSRVENMNGMFAYCYNLTRLDLGGFDTSNVTDMGSMFTDCVNLIGVDVSGFNTNRVTDMVAMFSGCSSLTEVDVSGFETKNVKDMSLMFNECVSLTHVDVNGFRTDSLLHTDGMFYGCTALADLDVSNFDSYLVDSMAYPGNNQAAQQIPDDFSDMYHEDFQGYDSWGWHETYIYRDTPDTAMHILYLSPASDNGTELAVKWTGPMMDADYRVEAEAIITLFGEKNGQNAYRLRMFALQGQNIDLRNMEMDSLTDLLDVTEKSSAVYQDEEQIYSKVLYVDAQWDSNYTGLVYLIEDKEQHKLYIFEYLVIASEFDPRGALDVILSIVPVELEDYGIDKRTGLLGM